jgi:hypothetical protein
MEGQVEESCGTDQIDKINVRFVALSFGGGKNLDSFLLQSQLGDVGQNVKDSRDHLHVVCSSWSHYTRSCSKTQTNFGVVGT